MCDFVCVCTDALSSGLGRGHAIQRVGYDSKLILGEWEIMLS